jgi:hypothetical protein
MNDSIAIGRAGIKALHNKSRAQNDLLVWTIYDHPKDFPNSYVVRPFSSRQGAAPLTVHFEHAQLEHVRGALEHLGLICMPRAESDDPTIVETWL